MPFDDQTLATIAENQGLRLDPVTRLRVICAIVAPLINPNARGDDGVKSVNGGAPNKKKPAS